jgi:AcrR family transcriptional regulator
MSEAPVKSRRAYNSRRRQAQAAATRAAIVEAARTLFERDGYVSTTMDAVAAEAGVALKTVYLAFTTKSGLLRAVWDLLLKGDLDVAPVADRPLYREMLDEKDPEKQLRMNAHNARVVKSRIAGILRVIRSAAVVDADAASLWDLIQSDFYENQRALVAAIDARSGLRRGLDVERATDILWTLNHPDVWLLLSGERGWTPEQFEEWFAEITCDQLLSPRRRGRGPRGESQS